MVRDQDMRLTLIVEGVVFYMGFKRSLLKFKNRNLMEVNYSVRCLQMTLNRLQNCADFVAVHCLNVFNRNLVVFYLLVKFHQLVPIPVDLGVEF